MSRNSKPPKGIYSTYEVVKVRPGKPIRFISVVKEWEGIMTHWWGGHSVKCEKPNFCQLCEDRLDVSWKGYLLGTSPVGGEVAIFQLTPLAAYSLEEITDTDRGLLGAIICLTRTGKRANSPLTADLRGWHREVEEKPFDVLERVVKTLYRQYSEAKVQASYQS